MYSERNWLKCNFVKRRKRDIVNRLYGYIGFRAKSVYSTKYIRNYKRGQAFHTLLFFYFRVLESLVKSLFCEL